MLQARAFPNNCEEIREIQTTGDAEDANNFFLESWKPEEIQKCFFLDPNVNGIFPTLFKEW